MKKDNKKADLEKLERGFTWAAGLSMLLGLTVMYLAVAWLENAPPHADWTPFWILAGIGAFLAGWPVAVAYAVKILGGDK